MEILIPNDEFGKCQSRENIPLKCKCCNNTFYRPKNLVQRAFRKSGGHTLEYCSMKCRNQYKREASSPFVICKQCESKFRKHKRYIKKTKNNFCSQSCSATYHNTHKEFGCRRSKLEVWLEKELTKLYPNLEIHYNKTNAINAELDVYIPSLKLAFEFNGIFHYEPIYGDDKLKRTQNNDQRKFQLCSMNNISLCVIDTHNVKYLKKERDKKFLDIIKSIVDSV